MEQTHEPMNKNRMRGMPCGTNGQRITKSVFYLRGWQSYFSFCQTPSVLRDLDQWLQRRLRSVLWKQWRRGRKRFAVLRKRGIGVDLAAKTAGGAHGPSHLAEPR